MVLTIPIAAGAIRYGLARSLASLHSLGFPTTISNAFVAKLGNLVNGEEGRGERAWRGGDLGALAGHGGWGESVWHPWPDDGQVTGDGWKRR